MNRIIPLVSVLLLTACAAPVPVTRAAFVSELSPIVGAFPKYRDAMARPYQPHVQGQGIEAVQEAVNARPYVTEPVDQWDAAAVWQDGGDCEDIALAKILELKAQGNDRAFLVIGNDANGARHAIAVVDDGSQLVALDNQEQRIVPLGRMLRFFTPLLAFDTKTGQAFANLKTGAL